MFTVKANPVIIPSDSSSKDPLGERMKQYEKNATSVFEPRQWAVIRIDGRAFHTWTKDFEKPFSPEIVDAMGQVTVKLCEQISGSVLGFCQSDEITIVLNSFQKENTQMWFSGKIQKMCSVSASIATGEFNRLFVGRPVATFDSRVFVLPNRVEVANNLLWRQKDAQRNAISMIASSLFSSKELKGVSTEQRKQMIAAEGVDIDSVDRRFLNGQLVLPETVMKPVEYVDRRTGEKKTTEPKPITTWKASASVPLNAQENGFLLSYLSADPS